MSWIPWLIGIVVGGAPGTLCALGIRTLLFAQPALRHPLAIVPWRTLAMGLLVATWSLFIFKRLWLGPISGGIMVAGSLSILTMAFTDGPER